jgi:hypothetical protein
LFLNNRYYDPTVGVFISVDPLVSKTGTPYLYANGNPTTLSDPSGLDPGWAHDNNPCNDAGYYACTPGGSSNPDISGFGPRMRRELWGLVPRARVGELLRRDLRRFVGSGDGVKDGKTSYPDYSYYEGRPMEPAERARCEEMGTVSCLSEYSGLRTFKNLAEGSPILSDREDGTLGNAQKHVLLAATLTWVYGEDHAREILYAHENILHGELLEGQEFDEFRQMDLVNNEVGIQLGLEMISQHGGIDGDYWMSDVFPYFERQISGGMLPLVYFQLPKGPS